jgi:RNA polymerase sigma factor FliA
MSPTDVKSEEVLMHLPLVKMLAARVSSHLPGHIEFDDLVGYGVVGLMEALREFDPQKKVKFSTFAFYRIRGAILDGLRALDWLPRPLRQKIQKLRSAQNELKNKLGREPLEEELAGHLHMEVSDIRTTLLHAQQSEIISLEEDLQENLAYEEHPDSDRTQGIEDFELLHLLTHAIKNLDEKERLVLSLYYYEELNLKEIGHILGLSESRVSQLLSKCIMSLQDKMEHIKSEIKT